MKQYPNIDAIIEDSDTKVQDLAKVIGVSTKQIRRWRDGTSEMGIEKLEKLSRQRRLHSGAAQRSGVAQGLTRIRDSSPSCEDGGFSRSLGEQVRRQKTGQGPVPKGTGPCPVYKRGKREEVRLFSASAGPR